MPALHYRCLVDSIAFNVRPSAAVPGNFIEFTVNKSDSTIKGDCKDLQWFTVPVGYKDNHSVIGAWTRSSVIVLAKSFFSSTACRFFISD